VGDSEIILWENLGEERMAVEELKREILELLEKDVEFRYAVAGYIGLSEILKRMDRFEENQSRLWEGQNRIWEEIRGLREGQEKLWENQNRLWENQSKLWENQGKLWEEVRSLREGQEKLWENVNKLWEGQNRLWEEVRSLREAYNKLALEQERMRRYMVKGFRELSRALGVTFEDHAAAFLEAMLQEMGYVEAKVERKYLLYEGEVIEVNMFCDEPLVVGEATVSVMSPGEAEEEVKKLIKRIKMVEDKYGRKPYLAVLSVARVTPEAMEALKTLAEKYGIKLVLGRDIEEEALRE